MIITIDGPIATGKSSVAKRLAEKLGFIYFDTGAMYRCITYGILKHKIDIDDKKQLQEFLDNFELNIKMYRGEKCYLFEGTDVTMQIRGEAVTAAVSRISAIGAVRDKLVVLQREMAIGVNAVFEGRDMGTTVFPHADLKIFLTGRTEVRAQRRFDELRTKFPEETAKLTLEQGMADIARRDTYDATRAISPLRQAEDAFVVDTSDFTVEEIVYKILEYLDSLPST